jgi:diaminohydroxyphosphoribosylaminopyrimidine deaminase/5-amino-6-(5-phosphoribosylamino)uracil reductase
MKLALSLAAKGMGRTSPNPMVGAVIVKQNKIIGQGYHQKAGTPHAEIHALREAGADAKGATLYVTLEPCSHYGRTPPCADAIITAGISHVVIGARDPNPLVSGRGIAALQAAGITTQCGLLEEEAIRMNEVFYKFITTKRPFVVLKCAMTLDGKIATRTGHSQWITGEAARQYGHRLRDQYDAILVGRGTILADDPLLTTRLPNGEGKNPVRIIVDSKASIPISSKVISDRAARTIIAATGKAPVERIRALQEAGLQVLVLPEKEGRVDMVSLVQELGRRDITSVLIEGGAAINCAALHANIVDKVHFFIAPKLVGGHDAIGPIGNPGINDLNKAVQISFTYTERLGEDLHLEGYVRKGE